MKNATYWMEYLERLAYGQETGKIKAVQAVEMNNTVGKVIALAKASLEAQRMMEKTKGMKAIPALEFDGDGPALSKDNAGDVATGERSASSTRQTG